jgi:hypothetical protein
VHGAERLGKLAVSLHLFEGGYNPQWSLSLKIYRLAQSMPRRWISLTSATSKSAALWPREE